MKPSTAVWILAPLVGCVAALTGALAVTRAAEAGRGTPVWDEEVAEFVRRAVDATYVDELSPETSRDMFTAAMRGYLDALPDEYNEFIPREQYQKWKDDTAGRYAGIGVKVDTRPQGLLLKGVFPGGPAARAGLRTGDVLTHVEGHALAGVDLQKDAHWKALKGAPGTPVTVTVITPAAAAPAPAGASPAPPAPAPVPRTLSIVRETIQPHTVFARRLGEDKKVGYLRVSEFAEATHGEFDRELDALVAAGVRAVIVDLRDNTGGVLLTTERMADRFLRSGVIVRTKGRTRDSSKTVVASEPDTVPDAIGLAVIVNGSSASASEVFAGCVQDHRRGVLVGTRTFGKFLVQNITEIPGKGAAVKVTTAKYMTPLGRWYQRNPKDPDAAAGLVPDVVVELTDDEQTRLRKSFESQDKLAWGTALEPTDVPPDWVDPQVERALEILSGKVVLQEIRTGEKRNG